MTYFITTISAVTSVKTITIYRQATDEYNHEYTLTPADILAAEEATYNSIWVSIYTKQINFTTQDISVTFTGQTPPLKKAARAQVQGGGASSTIFATIYELTDPRPSAGTSNGTTTITLTYPQPYAPSIVKIHWNGFAELQDI